jgi:hypothetical protein
LFFNFRPSGFFLVELEIIKIKRYKLNEIL